jgi:hypothetical protein
MTRSKHPLAHDRGKREREGMVWAEAHPQVKQEDHHTHVIVRNVDVRAELNKAIHSNNIFALICECQSAFRWCLKDVMFSMLRVHFYA